MLGLRKLISVASVCLVATLGAGHASTVFINEFHYDNDGTDVGEFVEIAGLAGTDLTGWQIELHRPILTGGTSAYGSVTLNAVLTDQSNGYGFLAVNYPTNGVSNASPAGIALIDSSGSLVEAIAYEGSFTATGGAADGVLFQNVGPTESGNTPIGFSIARLGTGSVASDFVWAGLQPQTVGSVNNFQTFVSTTEVPLPAAAWFMALGVAGLLRKCSPRT